MSDGATFTKMPLRTKNDRFSSNDLVSVSLSLRKFFERGYSQFPILEWRQKKKLEVESISLSHLGPKKKNLVPISDSCSVPIFCRLTRDGESDSRVLNSAQFRSIIGPITQKLGLIRARNMITALRLGIQPI